MSKKENNLTPLARSMRKKLTRHERLLWYKLKEKFPAYHFRKQFQIGNYIVDFVHLQSKLILECDGGQHTQEKDRERDLFLQSKGYKVLHIWNNELLANLDGILTLIHEHLTKN